MTLQLRLGFWPVKSGQCSNVLPIVSVVGPNYQFQLLPTLSSMFLESLKGGSLGSGLRLAARHLAVEKRASVPYRRVGALEGWPGASRRRRGGVGRRLLRLPAAAGGVGPRRRVSGGRPYAGTA